MLEKMVISILEVPSLRILGDTKWQCRFKSFRNNPRAGEEVGVEGHEHAGGG